MLLALIDVGGGGGRAPREAGAIPSEVRERANAAAGKPRPTNRQAADGAPDQHVGDLRSGHPVAVRLGADAYPIGDLGHPQVDALLLELLLVNDTIVAQLLRAHHIDEALLRDVFGPRDAEG